MSLLDAAIDAHGGMARWRSISHIEVAVQCGGLALAVKGQRDALRAFRATATTARPHVTIADLGTFDADQPRPRGMALRRRWTTDDLVHFTGYALWGYLTAPFVLAADDVRIRELRGGRRLEAIFPPRIPAHSARQVFHFDTDGVLRRLDYTAEVFLGPFGRARHECLAYRQVDGILVPVRRRATPRALPRPTLIDIEIRSIRFIPLADAPPPPA